MVFDFTPIAFAAQYVSIYLCDFCRFLRAVVQDCKRPFTQADRYFLYLHANKQYVLCGDDYVRRQHGTCHACSGTFKMADQLIQAGGELLATVCWGTRYLFQCLFSIGKKYHLDHYQCLICKKPVPTDDRLAIRNGEVYCHYHQAIKFAKRCSGCGEAIFEISVPDAQDSSNFMHENCAQTQMVC